MFLNFNKRIFSGLCVFFLILIVSFIFDVKLVENYHNFYSDTHSENFIFHNFHSVFSNIFFIMVGIYILFSDKMGLFKFYGLGMILAGIGSCYYHYNPSNITLLIDWIGMCFAFGSALSLFLKIEHSVNISAPVCILAMIFMAITSYIMGEYDVVGALGPWLSVQVSVLFFLLMVKKNKVWIYLTFLFYGIAKIFELNDIYFGNLIKNYFEFGGHDVKHFFAAFGGLTMFIWFQKNINCLK